MDKKRVLSFWNQTNSKLDKNQISIILLAHVQEPRGFKNQSQLQCNETERFSIEEFNEIYQGIVNAGYYIQGIYFNELDFISDFLEHRDRFKNCLIYNLARNGLGNNKKTIIPAFCELVGLKYTSSTSLTCGLCRNKYYFTTLLYKHNVPVPKSWLLLESGMWMDDQPPVGIQVICKPCSESASQGISESNIFFASPNEFDRFKGMQCIVQEYIQGIECEVPVFKVGETIKAFKPVGIDLGKNNILDENNSMNNQYGFFDLNKSLKPRTIKLIQIYAEKAFQILQMDVYGRIDFRVTSDETLYVFDVATMPYTTKHSSFAFAFEKLGFEYREIYDAIIHAAFKR